VALLWLMLDHGTEVSNANTAGGEEFMTADDTSESDWDRGTRELFARLIEAWDKRNARDFALLFASDGNVVGFDGSQVNGQLEVGAHLTEIFSHHQTPRYISIIRDVRLIATDVTLLRANSGLVPTGKDDIEPSLNAVQSMIAVKKAGAARSASGPGEAAHRGASRAAKGETDRQVIG
jgi:uncharacterized protein (TIGR02246 family)